MWIGDSWTLCYSCFGMRWRNWIKGCVSNVSFSVFINGRPRGKFKGEKGFRQGDLLSPFLFNLVADVLGRLGEKAKSLDLLRGVQVGREGWRFLTFNLNSVFCKRG